MLKNRPVVGILSTYNLKNEENDPYQDQAKFVRMYSDMVIHSGGIPIGLTEENITYYFPLCDAYIWPGGNKIWFSFYKVFEDVLKNKKPLLGICLGAQAIATFFNILEDSKSLKSLTYQEVYQKNKEVNPYLKQAENITNHSHYVTKDEESINHAKHKIIIEPNSFMESIYGKKSIYVVSLHSIVINRVSNPLVHVSASSLDGVVEALEYHEDNNHILGVQYHPEVVGDKKIFDWLLEHTNTKYQVLVNKNHPYNNGEEFQIVLYQSEFPLCINDSNMEIKTKEAFLLLKEHMKKLGYKIDVSSAYRTTKVQEEIYHNIIKEKGSDYAKNYVALPTYSEHETGLAIDVKVNIGGEWLDDFDDKLKDFYATLHSCCFDFGFILRYPYGKENITGYEYEPWHLRYVGNPILARKIMSEHLTLEEYIESEAKLCRKLPK